MQKFYILKDKNGKILYELSSAVYSLKDAVNLSNLCGGLIIVEKIEF